MALVTGACTSGGGSEEGGEPGEVTLDFWVFESGGIGSFLKTLETRFETENPNINIEFTAFPEENYGVKVDTAVAANKAPDMIVVFGPDYMRRGLLQPLDDMVEEKGIDLSTYSQAIVQEGDEFSCRYGGQLYCLGSYQGATMLLYNKDMLDAAGLEYPAPFPAMTPDQLVDMACQLRDEGNEVWGAGISDPMAFLPWEVVVSPDGRTAQGYVNGQAAVAAFSALARGYQDGCIPTSNILDPWEQGRDFFASGNLAMVITDFQDLPKVENAGINYGSTIMPTPTGYDPYFYTWTDSAGVMATSDNPEEAKEFIAFLTTEGQTIRYETSGDIPLDSKIAEEVNWAEDIPGREEGLEVITHGRPAVFVPERWDTYAPIWDAWDLIVDGQDAQSALDQAASDIQQNLDKAWEVWEEQGE
jgi:multiple sugar transport system substrate-binding protein